jgi:hypothetical protein
MGSNNYGVLVTDVGQVGHVVAGWDFNRDCRTLSIPSGSSAVVPDLPVIEECGSLIKGQDVKRRIGHFQDEVAVYDFGNGNFGLCLQDKHENHYFVEEPEWQKMTTSRRKRNETQRTAKSMPEEKIPEVDYTGTVLCNRCGALMGCERCEDPTVAQEMHRLLWKSDDDPMNHHIHLCDNCSNCTFESPEGERCGEHSQSRKGEN